MNPSPSQNEEQTELGGLARYQGLIPDWQRFVVALRQPLPTTVWVHGVRRSEKDVLAELPGAEALSWCPGAYRVPEVHNVGKSLSFVRGDFQIQEEVSLIPGVFLGACPGERILDLCAAPGNKAAQIAVAIGDRGTLVANDAYLGRMQSLRRMVERMSLTQVVTTLTNGATFPSPVEGEPLYDRVLADVPCSCEGTSRKNPGVPFWNLNPDAQARLYRLQEELLRRAVELCKVGGRIVYSTCTYAPEENERVLSRVLEHMGSCLKMVEPSKLPDLKVDPGISEWQGERFHPDVRLAVRIYPHRNDTGGFFVAVLEKQSITPAEQKRMLRPRRRGWVPKEEWQRRQEASQGGVHSPASTRGEFPADWSRYSSADSSPAVRFLVERFGFKAGQGFLSPEFKIIRSGRDRLSVVSAQLDPPGGAKKGPFINGLGLPLVREDMQFPKLSTTAAMRWGHLACKNVIEISEAELLATMRREEIVLDTDRVKKMTENNAVTEGYVLLRYKGVVWGLALFFPQSNRLVSQFPKGWNEAAV